MPLPDGKMCIRDSACILTSYRFVLKLHESVHKCLSAVFIKMAADVVKGLVIKMLN